MTTRTREEMEGGAGPSDPSKRYPVTPYLPLCSRGEVGVSPLGGLCATHRVTGTRRQGEGHSSPRPENRSPSSDVLEGHWPGLMEANVRASSPYLEEDGELSILKGKPSRWQDHQNYTLVAFRRLSTLLPLPLVEYRLTAFRQKFMNSTPTGNASDPPRGRDSHPTGGRELSPKGVTDPLPPTVSRVMEYTPTPTRLDIAPTCHLYFAPLLDETAPTTTNFFTAKDEDMFLKHSGITWSKASVRSNALIVLPISTEDHLEVFRIHPIIGEKFTLVSYIGKNITETADMEQNVRLLTPLVITPLPPDLKPVQATGIMWNTGDRPQNGPVTNGKRLAPPKSYYGRVWFPHKRNQILRHCFLDKPTARITPVIPTGFVDPTAVVLYYNGPGAVDTETISGFIKAYAGDLPAPAVVAQFFDPVLETDLQKWLLGFDQPQAAEKFLLNKDWTRVARHEKGAEIGIGKCGQTALPPTRTPETKRKDTKRGRGRGRK